MDLSEFKKRYSALEKKYKLPSFRKLCEDFDIEKVAEKESDYILREIRKLVVDKIVSYLRFFELLLNPANAPLFFLMLIKGISSSDRKLIEGIYFKLGSFEIQVIALDIEYSEKKEAEFLIKIYDEWQPVKDDMKKFSEVVARNWNNKSERRDKGYFG
ncbi:hypothetical protein HYV49_02695 [Candidatus Pacearchaeota archaeon]|nr:hypothetical protein [Candidatus Pacearchaeota archaeon]